MIKIYHNPRCSKSRIALDTLKKSVDEIEIIEYLTDLFTEESLKKVIKQLAIKPLELIRKNEPVYVEHFKGKEYSNDEWIKIMVENPKLIQRPIVLINSVACIARDEESLNNLITGRK
jgi:arsenate reductase